MVVLDSIEVAVDLLEKRSSIYSDRPKMIMTIELMGWDFTTVFLPYGEFWTWLCDIYFLHWRRTQAKDGKSGFVLMFNDLNAGSSLGSLNESWCTHYSIPRPSSIFVHTLWKAFICFYVAFLKDLEMWWTTSISKLLLWCNSMPRSS